MELRAEVLSLLRLQEGEGERGGKEQGAGERARGECGAGSADGEREELAFVRLYEVVVETRAALHLILEYCPGGDLFDLVIRQKRLTEAQAAAVFRQLLLAVHAMHRAGIVHRDLKPENILLSCGPGACRGRCTVAECNCSEIEVWPHLPCCGHLKLPQVQSLLLLDIAAAAAVTTQVAAGELLSSLRPHLLSQHPLPSSRFHHLPPPLSLHHLLSTSHKPHLHL
ncbi:unnamed protein product [Closterium sp. NIES-53]